MDCSMPGLPVHYQLPELAQIHVHWVSDTIQPVIPSNQSADPFSSSPQSFPASGSLPLSQFFASGGQRTSFSFSISPSNEYSGLISFRIDRFNLLAVQGTLKSLLQHHSSKASNLRHSAFFMVQLSHTYMPMWGVVSPQETDQDLPVSVQESLVEVWVNSLASGQTRGREHSPAHQQNIKDLLSMAPPIRIRPRFPLSQSLPLGSFHKPLILIQQRADRMKTTIIEN